MPSLLRIPLRHPQGTFGDVQSLLLWSSFARTFRRFVDEDFVPQLESLLGQ